MRSDIRWIGFRQEIPWILMLMGVGTAVLTAGVALAIAVPDVPLWLSACFILLPILAFVGAVFWVGKRAQCRRDRRLAAVAEQMGMTFCAKMDDDEPLPPHDLPLMAVRYGRPRSLLTGESSGVKVRLFDLAAGGSKSTRDQTVAYFPDALPGLPDFPTGLFGLHMPKPYATALKPFSGLSVEARAGQMIIYRWHHAVRPESYPAFLAIVDQIHRAVASTTA